MANEKIAEIQLITDGLQPVLKVTVPRGTTFADTVKLQPHMSDILGKLKGCPSCNSGVPIWFHEREEIEQVVRVDLSSMKRI
jgi:hypothetical protein